MAAKTDVMAPAELYPLLYLELQALIAAGRDDAFGNFVRGRLWDCWSRMTAKERVPFLGPGCLDRESDYFVMKPLMRGHNKPEQHAKSRKGRRGGVRGGDDPSQQDSVRSMEGE